MKQTALFLLIGSSVLFACNNQSDPVEKADSTNEVKQEQTNTDTKSVENTSNFLVKAADGGLTEVEAGKVGEQKATHKEVKDFAKMMVDDHSGANAEVKKLAAALNVTLPSAPSEENQKDVAKLNEKSAKDFDKDFMDQMVKDHKKTIDLFKDASDDDMNADVKAFVNSTIPKLQAHLDAAEAIRKKLK
ncbi:DUF4142 domain-containing protein [Pollutibacter soli]|uniref:DUF4142 domain-containing protein n=1 Tax=Pollutibacter soli TaxID=3034157 RepID=UPI003013B5FD